MVDPHWEKKESGRVDLGSFRHRRAEVLFACAFPVIQLGRALVG